MRMMHMQTVAKVGVYIELQAMICALFLEFTHNAHTLHSYAAWLDPEGFFLI